ncbi:hypothetical protein GOHSU_59_00080 [Gordonia hirsuta DSM 44140 = NBRC 16056]|uniref:Acyl-CoA thioesterase-like C-terminal domain-containing protein n=1 Tax=Gordonia hirsuta DSM 44140 = NBRC 16056 TaxID=1121927 RepID=L7LCR0_9ACTN|nr:acyl-CoA thioesterase domain-containing protein [Gordonia hirsuta]GAC58915.1 hypothetical protein GOHSU_59_00080 [Gordonia hirsuta DSM 44140 = NBRC 16056]
MAEYTFFTQDDRSRYLPTPMALSLWGPDALNGPAVCSVAAHTVESEHRRDGWRPARFTIELFKSARRLPTVVHTHVERAGGRIMVVGFEVVQQENDEDILVAKGVTVFLRESTDPPGARWQRPADELTFMPPAIADDDPRPWFGGDAGWSHEMTDYQNAGRHRMWSKPIPVCPAAPLTPFQRAVITAESASLMTNWGEGGIGFINGDLTVALARLPQGDRVGVEADTHLSSDGISVGTVSLYDQTGPFGTATVTALANTHAMIDFANRPRPPIWSAE